jgi:CBS domain-containing protein
MKVKDAMHKGVDWVSPDTPVTELAKLMREHDIGAIPIGENDRLIGMVTDRDIVCKGLAQDNFDALRATARDVMTPGIHRFKQACDEIGWPFGPIFKLLLLTAPLRRRSAQACMHINSYPDGLDPFNDCWAPAH